MRTTSLAVGLIFSLLLSHAGLLKQSPTQTKKEDVRPATTAPDLAKEKETTSSDAVFRQRGIDLIKDAGEEASKLDDHRSAARIQVAAGESLWAYDREAAQKFFRAAFDAALTYYREGKNEVLDPATRLTTGTRADFCQEIIRRISARDAALGHELSKAFSEEKQRGQEGSKRTKPLESYLRRRGDDALTNDLEIKAAGLLRTNQQAAIAEAKRIFAIEIPRDALIFIWQLAMQDRVAADQLVLWLLANIREDETADAGQLQILTPYFFSDQFLWITDGMGGQGGPYLRGLISRGRDFGSEELMVQWYIEVSFIVLSRIASNNLAEFPDAASSLGAAAYLAQWLEPRVAQVRPSLLPAWQALVNQLFSRVPPNQQSFLAKLSQDEKEASNRMIPQGGIRPTKEGVDRIKDLLEKAEKTSDPARRDLLHQEAALEAGRIGDLGRALEIAEKISDKDFRQQVKDWIYFNAATRALNEQELEKARNYAIEIKAPDQCAYLFCVMARAALKAKDKGRASDFLTEAEQRAEKADNSPEKVRALMSIANLFASFDLPRALESMAIAVRVANRVPSYSPEPGRMLRTLGNAAGQRHDLVQSVESVDLGTGMAALAAVDFDGALLLAQSLDNKALKLTAVVAVAASVLNKKAETKAPPEKAKD